MNGVAIGDVFWKFDIACPYCGWTNPVFLQNIKSKNIQIVICGEHSIATGTGCKKLFAVDFDIQITSKVYELKETA